MVRSAALLVLGAVLGGALVATLLPRRAHDQPGWRQAQRPPSTPPRREASNVSRDAFAAALQRNMNNINLNSPSQQAPAPRMTTVEMRRELARVARLPGALQGSQPDMTELLMELKRNAHEGISLLSDTLKSGDGKDRALAARMLAQFEDPDSISALFEAAQTDAESTVRAVASQSLALMSTPDTLPALQQLAARSPGTASEVNAIYGLCKHGDPEGLTRAAGYLEDTSRPPRFRAMLAANLALINDERLMPIVDRAAALFTGLAPVMLSVVDFYQNLGTPAASARLSSIATNTAVPAQARQAAANATVRN
jgi:hypothetical protein